MKIISYLKKGNSFPIILNTGGQKYLVKLRGGMSGKNALLNEWIGNKLGHQLNINTQSPSWIELKTNVEIEDIHIEVKDLIHKSMGLNIGFQYQENAIEIIGSEIHTIDKKEAEDIFLFDLMMINIDRTISNTNLMRVGTKIYSTDYESSLLFHELISNKNLLRNKI